MTAHLTPTQRKQQIINLVDDLDPICPSATEIGRQIGIHPKLAQKLVRQCVLEGNLVKAKRGFRRPVIRAFVVEKSDTGDAVLVPFEASEKVVRE